jgi:hypothetical protein
MRDPLFLRRIANRFSARIKRLFSKPPEDPDDPYTLVTVPVSPKPPTLSARAAAVPER